MLDLLDTWLRSDDDVFRQNDYGFTSGDTAGRFEFTLSTILKYFSFFFLHSLLFFHSLLLLVLRYIFFCSRSSFVLVLAHSFDPRSFPLRMPACHGAAVIFDSLRMNRTYKAENIWYACRGKSRLASSARRVHTGTCALCAHTHGTLSGARRDPTVSAMPAILSSFVFLH